MRVVLDTSVLVAAARSRRGASFALVRMIPESRFEVCLSVGLYMEWVSVLTRSENLRPGISRETTSISTPCPAAPSPHRAKSPPRSCSSPVFCFHSKTTPKPDFRAIFCRAGVPPAIEQFTPAGGTPALHIKSPNESGLWFYTQRTPQPSGAATARTLSRNPTPRVYF